jgi:uncharacterized membrane protein
MVRFFDNLALGIGLAGAFIIVFGVAVSLFGFFRLEIARITGKSICRKRDHLRQHLGSYLLLGLEFLVAADVVHTIIRPSLKELAVLGSIVGIRTLLNFFLNKELEHHDCSEDLPAEK